MTKAFCRLCIVSVVLTVVMVLSFIPGCSGGNDEETDIQSEQISSPENSPPFEESTSPFFEEETSTDPDAIFIALTFDDGPSPAHTQRLLDILEEEKVTATFFVLGQSARTYPDILRSIHEKGHEVANHSYDHLVMTHDHVTAEDIKFQIDETSDIIEEITGQRPVSFRPPQGAYNQQLRDIAQSRGLAIYHWSWESCPEDWINTDPEYIAQRVVENARDGHIVLLHDTNGHTVDAVPEMIKGLREKGFVFVTVDELIRRGPDKEPVPGKVYFYNFTE